MYRYAIEREQTDNGEILQIVEVEYTTFKKAIKKKAKGIYRV